MFWRLLPLLLLVACLLAVMLFRHPSPPVPSPVGPHNYGGAPCAGLRARHGRNEPSWRPGG